MRKNLRGVADHAAAPLACTPAAHASSLSPHSCIRETCFSKDPSQKSNAARKISIPRFARWIWLGCTDPITASNPFLLRFILDDVIYHGQGSPPSRR